MTQLTPAFKLTLLLSIGLHIGVMIQPGTLSPGHHQTEVNTRLNIRLNPVVAPRLRSEPLAKNPAKPKTKQEKQQTKPSPVTETLAKPDTPTKPDDEVPAEEKPTKLFKEARPQEMEQQRRQRGDVRSGISADESYQSRLLRHLEQYKHYPFMARRRQLEGRAAIRLMIATDGQIRDIECLEGNELFCEAAIQAARKAQPLPAPPASLSDRTFNYTMEYKLR
ncbi:cell envelope integrity protein TolA [Thiohalophilus thiocyanatoxydans]|uniref:TonB family protein n=1 Tax=Thiohalophilus thiocyanatoxydans TaxID=381308 RepID=A0A4R8IT72_9GAMM|nr:TonB family protein [Thiohalophilus thiocyanatoxydans]TDY04241.1 TonB family protein [Thiohalophilus thiocyanatoxydans]